MSSRNKKGKKKLKATSDGQKGRDIAHKKIHVYFNDEEIAEIKSILNLKNAAGVPFVIAATILYKFETLKTLLKDGYNANQTGQNNMTAMIWAVKYKYLDIIEYLLNNGADPTIKTDGGDNVLITALEHKLWDEESFINLWKNVKKVSFIDVNFTNKSGHNMLHMCVRRDWHQFLVIFLTEKPNVDAPNSNGVTPLMLACFPNNITVIDTLINAGADILKEDNHGRMTLCYEISTLMRKESKPPFLVANRIVSELNKKSCLENYLKRRIELIVLNAQKVEITNSTVDLFRKIIQFTVHYIDQGIQILINCTIFKTLYNVLKEVHTNVKSVKFLLEICSEILGYNEQSINFNLDMSKKITHDFLTGVGDLFLQIIDEGQSELPELAFNLVLLALNNCTPNQWRKFVKEHSTVLLPTLESEKLDKNLSETLRNQKRRLQQFITNLNTSISDQSINPVKEVTERKKTPKSTKESRKRSKSFKAKLAKMKNAEFTKRYVSNKKLVHSKLVKNGVFLPLQEETKDNPIVSSLQHILSQDWTKTDSKSSISTETKDWKSVILEMATNGLKGCRFEAEKLFAARTTLENAKNQKLDGNTKVSVNQLIDYLKQLIEFIIRKYQEHWNHEKASGHCSCQNINDHIPWKYQHHIEHIECREKAIIQELISNFDQLIYNMKDLAQLDLREFLNSINKIEKRILNYEIRGIKVMSYVCNMERITLRCTTDGNANTNHVLQHAENVLNNIVPQRKDIIFDLVKDIDEPLVDDLEYGFEVFCREASSIPKAPMVNKRKENEYKVNTLANGYHLINSTMALCDDSELSQKIYCLSDLNYPVKYKYQIAFENLHINEFIPKRLKSQLSTLQLSTSLQRFLNGEIRIASKEQRLNYVISAGVNFSAVELGLDRNNEPLAIKRIARDSWVGKIIKNLVDPLLGFVDNHLLHYFACEYENNELILATPLCKWSLTQYVQLVRSSTISTLPGMQIIKQFLTGLMVLHKCEIPVVHGNLKPSNIFIDFNGIVKIAEFGIHKALYKIIEAPKSSLIWFSKETLDIYRNSSIVEVTLKSDIQVTSMLIYFILTCGKHPFGDGIEEILKNIQRGITNLNVRNPDLRDLLLWMMLSDFNARPNIEQVLAHPFFWTVSKKWNFVLCCSGSNPSGYVVSINIDKLHRSVDTFCDAYIKTNWQDIIGAKYPHVKLNDHRSIGGLLKFIKYCHDQQIMTNSELCSSILMMFPTLPTALYRTLHNTNWLKHAVFMEFSTIF